MKRQTDSQTDRQTWIFKTHKMRIELKKVKTMKRGRRREREHKCKIEGYVTACHDTVEA